MTWNLASMTKRSCFDMAYTAYTVLMYILLRCFLQLTTYTMLTASISKNASGIIRIPDPGTVATEPLRTA